MPSGAKKRKAAKKKNQIQNQSNNSSPVHPHGNREGDVGEVEREFGGTSSMEGSRSDNGEEQVRVEESVVRVGAKEIKIEDDLGVKDGTFDRDEANRKSDDGGSSGSSGGSSSSEDESHGIDKGQAATKIDSLSGKSVEPVCDPLIAEASVIESTFKENGEKKFTFVEERICTSENAASHEKEEANVRSAETESTPKTSDPEECVSVAQNNGDKSTSSCIAPGTALDNGAQLSKDSVATQPVVAPSPYPAQKTSWKACCGLFELFAGSAA